MRLWIQFYNRKLNNELGEALGSDALQRLDGRLGRKSAVQEAYTRAYNLRKVHTYEAFRIMQGASIKNLVPVTGLISTNHELWGSK